MSDPCDNIPCFATQASQLEFARERLKLINKRILASIMEVPHMLVDHVDLSAANHVGGKTVELIVVL